MNIDFTDAQLINLVTALNVSFLTLRDIEDKTEGFMKDYYKNKMNFIEDVHSMLMRKIDTRPSREKTLLRLKVCFQNEHLEDTAENLGPVIDFVEKGILRLVDRPPFLILECGDKWDEKYRGEVIQTVSFFATQNEAVNFN